MSRTGRDLQVGDYATTDYNGGITTVRIIERLDGQRGCQSGILFAVDPILRNGDSDSRYDADWFRPIPTAAGEKAE